LAIANGILPTADDPLSARLAVGPVLRKASCGGSLPRISEPLKGADHRTFPWSRLFSLRH